MLVYMYICKNTTSAGTTAVVGVGVGVAVAVRVFVLCSWFSSDLSYVLRMYI